MDNFPILILILLLGAALILWLFLLGNQKMQKIEWGDFVYVGFFQNGTAISLIRERLDDAKIPYRDVIQNKITDEAGNRLTGFDIFVLQSTLDRVSPMIADIPHIKKPS